MPDNSAFKEMLSYLKEHHYIRNQQDFVERIGSDKASISLIARNKLSIPNNMFEKIKRVFPFINTDWLRSGEGEMLISDPESIPQPDTVPLIPSSAFAGGVSGFSPDGITLSQCERVPTPVPGAQFAITITGRSMEPDYHDGSLAYLRAINPDTFIPWGHTVVLDTENGAFIKKIYPDPEDTAYIWARSINPDYPPLHIPVNSIYRIFRVLATSRIFTTM